MFAYDVTRTIAARPEQVWAILTDPAALAHGMGILRIEGRIAPGARIKVWSEVSPERAFPVRVATLDAPRRMVWQGGMPLGLFRGVRTFTLDAAREGTAFHMREEFSGPFAPLIRRSMPDLTPSFAAFADGLKRKAEA